MQAVNPPSARNSPLQYVGIPTHQIHHWYLDECPSSHHTDTTNPPSPCAADDMQAATAVPAGKREPGPPLSATAEVAHLCLALLRALAPGELYRSIQSATAIRSAWYPFCPSFLVPIFISTLNLIVALRVLAVPLAAAETGERSGPRTSVS